MSPAAFHDELGVVVLDAGGELPHPGDLTFEAIAAPPTSPGVVGVVHELRGCHAVPTRAWIEALAGELAAHPQLRASRWALC